MGRPNQKWRDEPLIAPLSAYSASMASLQISARRLVLAGGFAIAIATAPAIAAFTGPTTAPSFGACPNGESEDIFTGTCTPEMVPNSPVLPASSGGLPSVDGVPCTGGNSGQCIGLSEDAPQYTAPQSTIGSSPTVTGSEG